MLPILFFPPLAIFLGVVVCRALRKHLLVVETGLHDLRAFGKDRATKINGTAVVCGGSVAGLLAARVCHDHFEHVIIVEPEAWLSTDEGREVTLWPESQSRARLIQYNSLHCTLLFFYQGMLAMFPNFLQLCKEFNIRTAPATYSANFWGYELKLPHRRFLGNLPNTLFTSRHALETLIRRITLDPKAYPNIKQMSGTATAVQKNQKKPGYLGNVTVRTKDGSITDINAALVVDCTGPSQSGAKWLQAAGFGLDDSETASFNKLKTSYDGKMHYSTSRFVVSPSLAKRLPIPGGFDNLGGSIISLLPVFGESSSMYSAFKDGPNAILMLCGSWGSPSKPKGLVEIRKHLESIVVERPLPDWLFPFLDMLKEAEDTMTCSTVRVPAPVWMHYEGATHLPANFVALGDSVCRLNPLAAQGCTKALLGALCMNTALQGATTGDDSIPPDFSRRFFKAQAAKLKPMWASGKLSDYAWSTTVPQSGESLSQGTVGRWYLRHLFRLSSIDEQAGDFIWRTEMMQDATSIDALHPVLVAKVLWLAFKIRWLSSPFPPLPPSYDLHD